MRLQPIVYVTNMAAATAWYARLLDVDPSVAGDHWTSFPIGSSSLALHYTGEPLPPGSVELSLVADEPLEAVVARVEPERGIADEAFGRSVVMRDPDGTLVQVNEHDRDLYDG